MKKKLTCIECPRGCTLTVDFENCRVISVEGNTCPQGAAYAVTEIQYPVRLITSAVLAESLEIKMVPVRTDKPVPRDRVLDVMSEIKKIRLNRPVRSGEIIENNLLGLGINLVATRNAAVKKT
ncbi:MAG: DUF1667 domain-containing protein [Candidatus Omnitrophica bacterium]|nr:DUF1667 domain-containing protein [Candidatus Omnitrophota bacterium]